MPSTLKKTAGAKSLAVEAPDPANGSMRRCVFVADEKAAERRAGRVRHYSGTIGELPVYVQLNGGAEADDAARLQAVLADLLRNDQEPMTNDKKAEG